MNKQGIPQRLNANYLKMIAIIAMTVDHLLWNLKALDLWKYEPYVNLMGVKL